MTGAEVLIGTKLLAPYASKVSIALGTRATYRLRIERQVRTRCPFKYPRRRFRKWLKTLQESDLAAPVEQSGPRLALDLDTSLSADGDWTHRPDHSSLALQLVEATYLAMLRISDPAVHRELSERWSRQRNDDLAAGLVEVLREVGRWTVADDDLAIWLRRRSAERTRRRFAAFNVEEEALGFFIAASFTHVPVVDQGTVRALVGPFGAGKSALAEEWHRRAIDAFGASGPVPIWLAARDAAAAGGFDQAASQFPGVASLLARGAAIVVDGLDEIDAQAAESIERSARVWVAGSPLSSVLLTARDGVFYTSEATLAVDGLDEAGARGLVELVSGRPHATYGWSEELVETIRRPFFALAAGALLAEGARAPRGQADLVRNLVERALRTGGAAATLGSNEIFAVLITLSVSLTSSNGTSDGLGFRERELAVATRLVARTDDGSVAFALPIFEQWFAAQALLNDRAPLEESTANPRAFDRWRWVLAIAVMSGTPNQVDDIIGACLHMNVGAGAWLVQQVAQGRQHTLSTVTTPPITGSAEVGTRLLRSARSWIDAAGTLAPNVLPIDDGASPIRLGARMDGNRLSWAWSAECGVTDEVVILPPHVHPLTPSLDWRARQSGVLPAGRAWPWEILRDDVARQVLPLLESPQIPTADGGIWQHEARYRTARIVANVGSALHPPLEREGLLRRIVAFMERMGDNLTRSTLANGPGSIVGRQALDLYEWLSVQSFSHFERPAPAPDLDPIDGRYASGFYSDECLLRFVAEVFGNACLAYEELADSLFGAFGWSLGANACRPLGFVGALTLRSERQTAPVLDYAQLPLELLQAEIRHEPRLVVSESGRAAISEQAPDDSQGLMWGRRYWDDTRAWMDAHLIESPFRSLHTGSAVVDLNGDRPASQVAAHWIWDDLKALSLASGTFPRLK